MIVEEVSLELRFISLDVDGNLIGTRFVENVREVSKGSLSGCRKLQKQVLSDIFKGQDITVSSVSNGKNMMRKMMCARKVLVVLDDINHIDHLEALAGHSNWFKPYSRIIITTKEEQVLITQRVNLIVDVNLLSDKEAVCLFSRKDLFETKAKGRSDGKAKEKILCSVIGGFGVDSATLSL
ncbi:Toll/interleukin-1 receptor domain-containing protein [Tanacetum coccineum]